MQASSFTNSSVLTFFACPDLSGFGSCFLFLLAAASSSSSDIFAAIFDEPHFGLVFCPGCRKVGAANWGTKSESTDSLGGDWHTPIRERADRYCPKCEKLERRTECKYGTKYWDMFSLPAEIISSKKDYNITMPYPANESVTIEDIDENYLRIQTRGTTYSILLNWRGKYITSQMFFPQFTRPTKKQVTDEVRKIYPNAIVLSFNPSTKDPTKPLLFTGDTNGPKQY